MLRIMALIFVTLPTFADAADRYREGVGRGGGVGFRSPHAGREYLSSVITAFRVIPFFEDILPKTLFQSLRPNY